MTARIFIAGDIVNTRHRDGEFCSADVKSFISQADFAIGNLEAPINGYGSRVRKSGPVIAQLRGTIAGLRAIGFRALTLANNHIMDYGPEGLRQTIQELDTQNLLHLGAGSCRRAAYKPLIIEVGGLRIALINACEAHHGVHDHLMPENYAGYAWLFSPEIPRLIQSCSKDCHATIVLAHGGLEHFHVPLREYRDLYQSFCRLGAKAVVGSHPHVPQGVERYGEAVIAYSLGNFYFDTIRYAVTPDYTYSLVLRISSDGRIDWEPYYTCKNEGLVQPARAEPPACLEYLNTLLKEDYDAHVADMVRKQAALLTPLLQRTLSPWGALCDIRGTVRYWASRLLKGRPALDRPALLHHLLRNESYLFALRDAAAFQIKPGLACSDARG